MKILIDTNVALDILLRRQDYANAALVFSLAQRGIIRSYISASAITDIFYLSQKGRAGSPKKYDTGFQACGRNGQPHPSSVGF